MNRIFFECEFLSSTALFTLLCISIHNIFRLFMHIAWDSQRFCIDKLNIWHLYVVVYDDMQVRGDYHFDETVRMSAHNDFTHFYVACYVLSGCDHVNIEGGVFKRNF